jgi:hypothetical protein
MAVIGYIATAIAAIIAFIGLILGIRSIPDLNRYRRLRKM